MRPDTSIVFFVLAAMNVACGQEQPINFEKPNCDLIITEIARATNEARAENQLPPLKRSAKLTAAAQSHAKDMVRQNFFSHENPHDDSRRTMEQRIAKTGFKARPGYAMAENITINWGIRYNGERVDVSTRGVLKNADGEIPRHSPRSLAKALVKQWMESPGHKANILRPNLQMGAGLAFYIRTGFNDIVAVKACQIFGTPLESGAETSQNGTEPANEHTVVTKTETSSGRISSCALVPEMDSERTAKE